MNRVLAQIAADYCEDNAIQINIVGWSRGATAAVEVARRLQSEGIYCCNGKPIKRIRGGRNRGKPSNRSANLHRPTVNFLGLYDAVEMVLNFSELFPGDQGFPNSITNVQAFFHAMKTQDQLLFPTTDFNHPDQIAFDLNTYVQQKNRRGRPTGNMVPAKSSHGNIGVDPLNSGAHREMIRRAQAAGVNVDSSGL